MVDTLSNFTPHVSPAGLLAGLYIHIPFCRRKCPYCDFYSVTDTGRAADFLTALETEMRLRSGLPLEFDTVYMGGGTPSVLGTEDIRRILRAAENTFQLRPGVEITLEVNPGTVSRSKLQALRSAGINRLSIGVQSFRDLNLKFLGRIHSARDASAILEDARDVFPRIGLDLIYGLPGQTADAWHSDLARAVRFEPDHISCYSLTCEPGTPLFAERQAGRFRAAADETVAGLFLETSEWLQDHGYQHYEISNFARGADARSRHNCKYWSGAPYIGLGPSAHSFVAPERRWNRADVGFYIQTLSKGILPLEARETLTASQMMIETVYLGLRQADGIDLIEFEKRFGTDFRKMFKTALERYEEQALLRTTATHCRPTPRGLLMLDAIAAELVDKIPDKV
jgi:oxygen-independent coproporphyrinogen-3 oxidase